jgi:hypothetical protein
LVSKTSFLKLVPTSIWRFEIISVLNSKKCHAGWTNSRTCNEDVDECAAPTSPCLNNATCVNTRGGFRCACAPGCTGTYCEDKLDYCSSGPCIAAQTITCTNMHAQSTFACFCKPGFTGPRCETQIDYCGDSNPCMPGQVERCVNYQWGYKCVCRPGYTGTNCEVEENECASMPCSNGGTCIDRVNSYSCVCPVSFSGERCTQDLNPCKKSPYTNLTVCGPFGTCYAQTVTLSSANGLDYYCQCAPGYQGAQCQNATSFCATYKPCLNAASCVDLSPTEFKCLCRTSFTGKFCERLLNPCATSAPLCNSGTCLPTGYGNYTCLCPATYTGTYCQTFVNPCEPNPCLSGRGQCQVVTQINGTQGFKCNCVAGKQENPPLCILVFVVDSKQIIDETFSL